LVSPLLSIHLNRDIFLVLIQLVDFSLLEDQNFKMSKLTFHPEQAMWMARSPCTAGLVLHQRQQSSSWTVGYWLRSGISSSSPIDQIKVEWNSEFNMLRVLDAVGLMKCCDSLCFVKESVSASVLIESVGKLNFWVVQPLHY
jgi:hypothetical protein